MEETRADPEIILGSQNTSRKNSKSGDEPDMKDEDDLMTATTLEKNLREQLPDPEKITRLSDAKNKVGQLNELVIIARKDLLRSIHQMKYLKSALDTSVELNNKFSVELKKQQEGTKDLAFKMLIETKGQMEGALSMFSQSMKQMTFSMEQWMSDEKTIQELLIPLAREFNSKDFSCSDGHVYMPLQPDADDAFTTRENLLSEYSYGITFTYTKDGQYHLEFEPKELSDSYTFDSFKSLVGELYDQLPYVDDYMIRWLSKNAESDADRILAKKL